MRRLIGILAAVMFLLATVPARAAAPPGPYPSGPGVQQIWVQTMLNLLYTGGGGILQADGSGQVTAGGPLLGRSTYNYTPIYDQASGVLASNLFFQTPSAPLVVPNGKEFDYFRWSQVSGANLTYQVGVSSKSSLFSFNLESTTGSDVTSNLYGVIGQITNDGAGTVTPIYGRASAAPGSTGPTISFKGGVDCATGNNQCFVTQYSENTTINGGVIGAFVFDSTNATFIPATSMVNGTVYKITTVGTTNFITYGASANIVSTVFTANGPGTGTGVVSAIANYTRWMFPDNTLSFSQCIYCGYAVGAGNFAELLNIQGSADLFTVDHLGNVLSAGNVTGFDIVGTNELVAASGSNGITITQAAITRNNVAGSVTFAAGTNAGNSMAFQTAGVTRMAVSDTGVAISSGAAITSSGPGGALGNPAFVASSVTKTCGATIVVTNGVVTSC